MALVRRRGWVVVLAVLVVTVTPLALSVFQAPVYQARDRVLADAPDILGSSRPSISESSSTETEAQILLSEPVQNLVRYGVGEAPQVAAVPVGASQVLDVVAESTDRGQGGRGGQRLCVVSLQRCRRTGRPPPPPRILGRAGHRSGTRG